MSSDDAEDELLTHLSTFEVGTVLMIDGQVYHLQDSSGVVIWRRAMSLSWWKHHQLASYLNRQRVRVSDITELVPKGSA